MMKWGHNYFLLSWQGIVWERWHKLKLFVKVSSMFSEWGFVFRLFGFVHNHVTRKHTIMSSVNFYSRWVKTKQRYVSSVTAYRHFFLKYPSWGIFRQNPAERGVVISQQRRTTDGNFDWMKVLIAPIQKNKVHENGMRKDVASGELFAGSNLQ